MTDKELVKNCISKDQDAWRIFYRKYKEPIARRIKQIFFRHSFRHTDNDLAEAFDFVIDHFLFGKAFEGFEKDISLDCYVIKVTTHAVIDWYRKKTTAGKMYGLSEVETCKSLQDETVDEESTSFFDSIKMEPEENLYISLMLIRYRNISENDINLLSSISGNSRENIFDMITQIKKRINDKAEDGDLKLSKMTALYLQINALSGRTDTCDGKKISKKEKQYRSLLQEYQKTGFEPFPKRNEIAKLLNWDINKIDRIQRKIGEKIKARKAA